MNQRAFRVAANVRTHLASLLPSLLQWDPVLEKASVRITHVRMSPDLRHAFVFVFLGDEKDQEAPLLSQLQKLAAPLQKKLAPFITHKFIPIIKFCADHQLQEHEQMRNIFHKIQKDISQPPQDD
jgi:ribosome-binding factor A